MYALDHTLDISVAHEKHNLERDIENVGPPTKLDSKINVHKLKSGGVTTDGQHFKIIVWKR